MWKSNSLPPVIILFLKKFLRSACVCMSVAGLLSRGNSHRNPKLEKKQPEELCPS